MGDALLNGARGNILLGEVAERKKFANFLQNVKRMSNFALLI